MFDFLGTLKTSIIPAEAAHPPRGPGRPFGSRNRPARERHKMVVMLNKAGWKNTEIAEAMGYSPVQVSVILKSDHPDLVRIREMADAAVFKEMTDPMLRFRQEAMKSVEALVEVRDQNEDIGQKRLAARDILDRAGYSVVRKQINATMDVPIDRLEKVFDQLAHAEEVQTRKDEWAVVSHPTPDK